MTFPGSIGIDFGNRNFRVAVWNDKRVHIINKAGLTPFDGLPIKSYIGASRYSDRSVPACTSLPTYRVCRTERDNSLFFDIVRDGESVHLTPQELATSIFAQLKGDAEEFLGMTVDSCVVAIPAGFTSMQRRATRDAACAAGMTKVELFSEQVCAATAFCKRNKFVPPANDTAEIIIIFDLGGGSLDVSLISVVDDVYIVEATAGIPAFGGEDFTNCLVSYFTKHIQTECGLDISDNPAAVHRLWVACEDLKQSLSSQDQVEIRVNSLVEDFDFCSTMTRTSFEKVCADLFRRCLEPVQEIVKDTNLNKRSVHEVVLVGGSTRMPKIHILLSDFFGGMEPNTSLDPHLSVVEGAALVSSRCTSHDESGVSIVVDVLPRSLGCRILANTFKVIIKKNTTLPCQGIVSRTTFDNHPNVFFEIYEGDSQLVDDCYDMGGLYISGIRPAPAGVPDIKVTFSVDCSGVLDVTAVDLSTTPKTFLLVSDS
eukprot:TRINITY_DN17000_c0_g1_i1.p1 TRINITY_DN17000_c0_g1~~TRINITY_DN17000_c0_g1_i1.p1  ORF type:complete len:484 (+),score=73.04 TRINITY_DN17000_c0_g1_i1:89-1540(+)